MCAGDIGLPELIELLPHKPEDAVTCRLCQGTRWEEREPSSTSHFERWCCRRCRGLGWTFG
jgi:hypothetical protein